MVKKASELKGGDVIRFEYAGYGNWLTCNVIVMENKGASIYVKGSRMGKAYDFVFSQREEVQVLGRGTA